MAETAAMPMGGVTEAVLPKEGMCDVDGVTETETMPA